MIYRFFRMVKKQRSNNDDKCFQYAVTVALNYEQIKKDLQEYQKLSLLLISIIGKK